MQFYDVTSLFLEQLVAEVQKLNADPTVHGMIVQVPLDATTLIDSDLVLDTISPNKDVDGLVTTII